MKDRFEGLNNGISFFKEKCQQGYATAAGRNSSQSPRSLIKEGETEAGNRLQVTLIWNKTWAYLGREKETVVERSMISYFLWQ